MTERGRPTKYDKKFDDQAYKLTLLGLIDTELADFFEVDEATIHRWKEKYPDFCESIKNGKSIANANVAQSLYRKAVGYSHPELKVFNHMGDIVTHEVTKHYAPDTQAASLFLRNREAKLWRDKIETENKNTNTVINLDRDDAAL